MSVRRVVTDTRGDDETRREGMVGLHRSGQSRSRPDRRDAPNAVAYPGDTIGISSHRIPRAPQYPGRGKQPLDRSGIPRDSGCRRRASSRDGRLFCRCDRLSPSPSTSTFSLPSPCNHPLLSRNILALYLPTIRHPGPARSLEENPSNLEIRSRSALVPLVRMLSTCSETNNCIYRPWTTLGQLGVSHNKLQALFLLGYARFGWQPEG